MTLQRPGRNRRITQRNVIPQGIRQAQIGQQIMADISVDDITFSITDGTVSTITSTITNTTNEEIRQGAVPFFIALFEASSLSAIAPGTNQIPMDVTTDDYNVYGPFAMPDYTVNGKRFYRTSTDSKINFATDGNNLVIKTSIQNNSGGAKTVTALVGSRIMQGVGGGGTS